MTDAILVNVIGYDYNWWLYVKMCSIRITNNPSYCTNFEGSGIKKYIIYNIYVILWCYMVVRRFLFDDDIAFMTENVMIILGIKQILRFVVQVVK